jgi:hypothetical protein
MEEIFFMILWGVLVASGGYVGSHLLVLLTGNKNGYERIYEKYGTWIGRLFMFLLGLILLFFNSLA